MSNFLFELYTEEVPARYTEAGMKFFVQKINHYLQHSGNIAKTQKLQSFATANRLVVFGNCIADAAAEVKGPKVGAPDIAKDSFIKKYNAKPSNITESNGYIYYIQPASEDNTVNNIAESVLKALKDTKGFWKNKMTWETSKAEWIRPIRNICCIYNGHVINISYGDVSSGDEVFLCKKHNLQQLYVPKVKVSSYENYLQIIKEQDIEIDAQKRSDTITSEIDKIAAKHGINPIDGYAKIIQENVYLTEKPIVITGEIPSGFLNIPQAMLITTMVKDQKYVPFLQSNGNISPYFAIIAENGSKDGYRKSVADGHQKVLQARLWDAKVFFEQDASKQSNITLEKAQQLLSNVKDSGGHTLLDKANAIAEIALEGLSFDKHLYYYLFLDLITDSVKEFTELQGKIGSKYIGSIWQPKASNQDLQAIEQVLQFMYEGPVPGLSSKAYNALLAYYIYYINDNLAKGNEPTPKSDPFALKKHASFVSQVIMLNKDNSHFNINKMASDKTIQFMANRIANDLKKQILQITFNDEEVEGYAKENGLKMLQNAFTESASVNFTQAHDRLKIVQKMVTNGTVFIINKAVDRIAKIIDSVNSTEGTEVSDKKEINAFNLLAKKIDDLLLVEDIKNYSSKLKQGSLEASEEMLEKLKNSAYDMYNFLDTYLNQYRVIENPAARLQPVTQVLEKLQSIAKLLQVL